MKTDTAEEVLDRWVTWDYELDKVADKIFFLKAMEEHASQQCSSLKEENERLKESLKFSIKTTVEQADRIKALEEALRDSLQMMEQTMVYREANGLTVGNVFLECAIDKAMKLLNPTPKTEGTSI
jgi:tRNA 2-selenouridine synthase SelU